MRALQIFGLFVVVLAAQDTKPSDPITDRMRYENAAAQRDYLLAQKQADTAMVGLRAKIADAEKACVTAAMSFDVQAMACMEKK